MRFFWLLPVVPRPQASFLAVHVVTLGTYLAFSGLEARAAGLPAPAFHIAMSVFVLALLGRNLILTHSLWRTRISALVAASVVIALPWLAMAILGAQSVEVVQLAITAWLLAYAAFLLATVQWMPENLPHLQSIWASDPVHGPSALTISAGGYVLRAVTLAALALWSTELAWVLFMTFGWVALSFLVNCVIVAMIAARLSDDD